MIIFILPSNRAGARREQAGNGFEQSRFASAVGADEGDHFAGANHQIDAVKGQKRAVGNLKIFYFEHALFTNPFKTFNRCAPFKPSPLFDAAQGMHSPRGRWRRA